MRSERKCAKFWFNHYYLLRQGIEEWDAVPKAEWGDLTARGD